MQLLLRGPCASLSWIHGPTAEKPGAADAHLWIGAAPVWALLLLALTPIGARAQDAVDTAAWLAGCWVATSGQSRTDEIWMAPEGGMMVGMSRSVRGGVARGYELVVLHQKDGDLTFSAYPSGQSPADFRATEVSATLLRFENPQHDFPQAIEYLHASPDSLIAHVYGDVESPEPAFSLRYARNSC